MIVPPEGALPIQDIKFWKYNGAAVLVADDGGRAGLQFSAVHTNKSINTTSWGQLIIKLRHQKPYLMKGNEQMCLMQRGKINSSELIFL